MEMIASGAILIAALITPFYMYAFFRFHRILASERPELVDKSGSLSFFYRGLPRSADPNVTVAVIRAAFSPVPGQLSNASAARYARMVRFGLSVALPLYLLAFGLILSGAA